MRDLKGLLVSIYLFPLGDATNNGLSAGKKTLLLAGDGIKNVPFDTEEDQDYLVCEYRPRFKDYIATPKSLKDSGKRPMFGGNFAYTSDDRFPTEAPIKIFDRVE